MQRYSIMLCKFSLGPSRVFARQRDLPPIPSRETAHAIDVCDDKTRGFKSAPGVLDDTFQPYRNDDPMFATHPKNKHYFSDPMNNILFYE